MSSAKWRSFCLGPNVLMSWLADKRQCVLSFLLLFSFAKLTLSNVTSNKVQGQYSLPTLQLRASKEINCLNQCVRADYALSQFPLLGGILSFGQWGWWSRSYNLPVLLQLIYYGNNVVSPSAYDIDLCHNAKQSLITINDNDLNIFGWSLKDQLTSYNMQSQIRQFSASFS